MGKADKREQVVKGTLVLRSHSQVNIGDKFSSPALYFDLGPTVDKAIKFAATNKANKRTLTVVGGGGMFRPQVMGHLRRLFSSKRHGKVVVWGAGLNNHAKLARDEYPNFVYTADLLGVRDWNKGPQWVPCATCASLAFDTRRTATCEIVIYDHYKNRVPVSITGAPRSTNAAHSNLNAVLDFLGQGDVVLTTSYHGAYWATLLGRKVIVWPFSSRFFFMRHPPVLADNHDWQRFLTKTQRYTEALGECREANVVYHSKIMDLIK